MSNCVDHLICWFCIVDDAILCIPSAGTTSTSARINPYSYPSSVGCWKLDCCVFVALNFWVFHTIGAFHTLNMFTEGVCVTCKILQKFTSGERNLRFTFSPTLSVFISISESSLLSRRVKVVVCMHAFNCAHIKWHDGLGHLAVKRLGGRQHTDSLWFHFLSSLNGHCCYFFALENCVEQKMKTIDERGRERERSRIRKIVYELCVDSRVIFFHSFVFLVNCIIISWCKCLCEVY